MVERDTIAQNMGVKDFTAIVLYFMVGLWRTLRRQEIGPDVQARSDPLDFHPGVSERQATSRGDVHDLILELQVRKANSVGKAAGVEVQSDGMNACVVLIAVHRIAKAEARRQEVGKVGVAVKGMRVVADSVIRLGQQ